MGSTRMRWTAAGALAACVGVGGFAAGRFTHPGQAQAAPAVVETPSAGATDHAAAAGHAGVAGLPSFASIVSDAPPAVVHLPTVSVVNAADTPPAGSDDDDRAFGPDSPLAPNSPLRAHTP